jgi:serine protease Do
VVAQLKDKGYITRGWLGVQVQPVTADIADSLGMKQAKGAMVDNPQDGSPAAKAGIEAGDVITAVNGTEVKDARDLARNISMMAPGASVKLDVLHKGEAKTVSVALGEMPNDRQANAGESSKDVAGTPRLGLRLAPASEVDGAGDKGVVVVAVDPEGPAAEHGFKTGDVILNVSGKTVANAADVKAALAAAKESGKNTVLMHVKTADATRFVAVPLAKG